MEEIWKDVYGYEGHYQIGEKGVKSLKVGNGRMLKAQINSKGYPFIKLYKKGPKCFTIHRLIAFHFMPNPEKKPCINHKNGIKTDFRIKNLEWCDHSENQKHAYRTGLRIHHNIDKFGKDHYNSKAILQYSIDGVFVAEYGGLREASRITGINKANISMVCNGKRNKAGGCFWKYK